jgi:DNA-binding beta-propeller fold protein YncE
MKHAIFIIIISVMLISCATQEAVKQKGPTVFYPPLPVEPRIQFLTSIMFEKDLEVKRSSFDAFLLGEQPRMKRIGRPVDIGSTKGKIYVSDRLYKKLLFIDLENNEFNYVKDSGIGTITEPANMTVTDDGLKYLADMARKQILVYDENDEFLKVYGDIDQFKRPIDVAVYENRVYVTDTEVNKVLVLDKDSGKTIQEIGGLGREEGMFYKPSYLAVDIEGNLYVTDSFNFRVQVFDPKGKYIRTIGFHGDVSGAFSRPKGLAIDKYKHLYVADAAFENVQIFDANTGQLLLFFGGFGAKPGSMYLPATVYIDYHNVEYFKKYADKDFEIEYLIIIGNLVSEKRIGVYGFGKWVGPSLTGGEK